MFPRSNSPRRPAVSAMEALSDEALAMPPETDTEGCVEYKLRLVGVSEQRLEHLTSQLRWRLSEGNGEAFYELGVRDDGVLIGLDKAELDESMATLTQMAAKLHADCSLVRQRAVPFTPTLHATDTERHVVEVLVRRRVNEDHFLEIRAAILGASDAGKSTLLSVLAYSDLDNGYGRARSRAFNHKHELESGRTSSLKFEPLGFDSAGNVVNYATNGVRTPQDVCERSSKIVTFVDTCGMPKFLPTTITAITATAPAYAMLIVNAANFSDMTREHLGMLLVLRIPLFIVITKIDVTPQEVISQTLSQLVAVLKSPGRRYIPYIIKNEDDLVAAIPPMSTGGVIPIFLVSSVTGTNLPLLTKFLNLLPPPPTQSLDALTHAPVEFQVHDVYTVPNVGTVIGGHVLSGTINVVAGPARYVLGPFADGTFRNILVTSIHRFCRPVGYVKAAQSATLAVRYHDDSPVAAVDLRRGMALLHGAKPTIAAWEVDVQLHVLYHPTALRETHMAIIFCGAVRQAARVVHIEGGVAAKTGVQCLVRFRFLSAPEWLKPGMTVLAREGAMKCIGTIMAVAATPTVTDCS